MKIETKEKTQEILILMIISILVLILTIPKVKADTILHGNLTQQVTRIWQTSNGTRLCDSWASPAVCTLNVGTDTTLNGTFLFKANTYYGYQGYKYQFSGQIEGVGPQISFLNVSIMTNPGGQMGYCETKTSTNGTSVSFTTTCDIPGGLKGQDYANYLNFNLGTTVKLSQFTINLKLDSDYFLYQDNSTQINNNIEDIKNADIGENSKEQPDQTDYNNYQQSEEDLFNKVEKADTSQINIGLDIPTTTWIWDTMTTFLQTHELIFIMFISILSIGIIKLALGR